MEDILISAGLNESQAQAYLYVLKQGEIVPPTLARALSLTRSNAYKVLDSLVETGLVRKSELNKKFVYRAEDPIALTNLVAQERNRIISLEQSVRESMSELRGIYEKSSSDSDVRTFRGDVAIKSLYVQQAKTGEPIYFIKSRADASAMGLETMEAIRQLVAKQSTERHGIIPATPETGVTPLTKEGDELIRTWIDADDYTAPVEWSVSGDELLIINFGQELTAIHVKNPVIAKAFKELWQLLDNNVRQSPNYKALP